jgi:hypothetical protein
MHTTICAKVQINRDTHDEGLISIHMITLSHQVNGGEL